MARTRIFNVSPNLSLFLQPRSPLEGHKRAHNGSCCLGWEEGGKVSGGVWGGRGGGEGPGGGRGGSRGLVLHWKATSGRKIKAAVVASGAAAGGWFAVGWSPKGKMDGSNAVAMEDSNNPPGVYDLEGTSAANAASWTVGSPSISSAGGKVTMKFIKNKGDGASVKVKANGNNNIVWAYGDGTAVSTHTNR
ncbi:unnamed protein product [Closterium sp. NIES-64]|nr:unnamed protein product [Closterium sp. NIES-64]